MKDVPINYSQLAQAVLLKYKIIPQDLRLLQSKGLKTLWKVTYKNMPLCLKRLNQPFEKALFSVNAQIYIFNNGGNVPKIYPDAAGRPITEYKGQLFVLYSWINGRDMNLDHPKGLDLPLALRALSKFHGDSTGYEAPTTAIVSSKLGHWPRQYESMKNRMLKIKELCTEKSNNVSCSTLLRNIDPIIEICNNVLISINASSYKDLCNIKLSECSLCHQDFGTGNVMLSNEIGTVIDLDSVTYDLPVRDLRKIMGKRMMKSNDFNMKNHENIINYYEANNTLSKELKEILKIDLMFPHWFFNVIKNMHKSDEAISSNSISSIAKSEQNKYLTLQK